MRTLAAIVLAAQSLLPAACSTAPAPAPVQPAKVAPAAARSAPSVEERRKALRDLLAEEWEWTMRTDPEWASARGDHRYDDRWTDRTPAGIAARLDERRRFLARFEAIDPTGLPDQDALDHRLMIRDLREAIDEARFEEWLMPVEQMGGVHLELAQLVSLLRFANAEDYEHYLARLRAVPRVFDQVRELMRAGMEKKLMPPRAQLERTIGQTEDLARARPDASPFAEPLRAFPTAIPPGEQMRLRAEVLAAIRDDVLPAYARFATFLRDEYVPRGRAEPGAWSLPDGEARYASAVKRFTTTDLGPDEIHQIGLREVARIEGEQTAIATALGFRDLPTFRRHLRADRKRYATSRQDILTRYQTYTDGMYAQLPRLFGRLPRLKMVILPIEEYREKA